MLSSATLASGHTFTTADPDSDVALVSKDYAASKNLTVGSSLTIAGKKFTVIGIVSRARGSNRGTWLSVAVLAAAFGLAGLLTMSAVSRRVRNLGTLKALGWKKRRIIAVLHECASVLTWVGSPLVVSGLPSKANPHALAGGSRRRA